MDAMPPLPPTPVPPPTTAVPAFSPQDADHLRMLSIAHYVVGGLIALFSLIFIVHIVLGVTALNEGSTPKTVKVTATKEDGTKVEFDAVVRIDTPGEADYFRNDGILQYVLRSLVK